MAHESDDSDDYKVTPQPYQKILFSTFEAGTINLQLALDIHAEDRLAHYEDLMDNLVPRVEKQITLVSLMSLCPLLS